MVRGQLALVFVVAVGGSVGLVDFVATGSRGSHDTTVSEQYYCGSRTHSTTALRDGIGEIVDRLYDAPLLDEAKLQAKMRHDGGVVAKFRSLRVALPHVVQTGSIAGSAGALNTQAVALSDGLDDNLRPIYLKFPGASIRKAHPYWVLFATTSKEKVCR